MPATLPISAPLLGRDLYASAALGALASAHAADGKPSAKPVEGIHLAGEHAGTAGTVAPRRKGNEPYSASSTPLGDREADAIPFLAQRLAQEGAASFEDTGDEETALPSVRSTALAAYGAARDSTVEYLSPAPLFDLRV